MMTITEAIERLRALGTEQHKLSALKLGIPMESSLGVATREVRKLAKEMGRNKALAEGLWHSGYHEARLLAVLVMPPKETGLAEMDQWMADVISWDLCDHLCKHLLIKLPGYRQLVMQWCAEERLYYKRAAYALMVSAVVHDKKLTDELIDDFLAIISANADDERPMAAKAISWALREIGKRDFASRDKALAVACRLRAQNGKGAAWIGRDAAKELETLVQVAGRKRLISAATQMGREQQNEE